MKQVPMKFGEYVWHHNPQNISFECDKSVAEMKSPFGEAFRSGYGAEEYENQRFGTAVRRELCRTV